MNLDAILATTASAANAAAYRDMESEAASGQINLSHNSIRLNEEALAHAKGYASLLNPDQLTLVETQYREAYVAAYYGDWLDDEEEVLEAEFEEPLRGEAEEIAEQIEWDDWTDAQREERNQRIAEAAEQEEEGA